MSNEQASNDDTLKRWTTKCRGDLVLEILQVEATAAEATCRYGLTVAEIEQWKEAFSRRCRERPAQPTAQR